MNYNFEGAKKLVLCGETGHGKSTLLNALVGAPVLPAKCDGDACTKVPIELHSSKDETLQVEIEFLPSMQRKDELERQFSLWSYEGHIYTFVHVMPCVALLQHTSYNVQ